MRRCKETDAGSAFIRGIGEIPDPEGKGIDLVQMVQATESAEPDFTQVYCRLCGEHMVFSRKDLVLAGLDSAIRHLEANEPAPLPKGDYHRYMLLEFKDGTLCDPCNPLPIDCVCGRCRQRTRWEHATDRPLQ